MSDPAEPRALPRSVGREVLRLTGPAVLTSLLQTVVFLADRVMIGRYSETALASMQISGPVLWSVFSIFFGSMIGAVALVARSVGGGDHARASEIARTLLRFAAMMGVVVGVLGMLGAEWIASVMAPDESPEIIALATEYMFVFFLGFPAVYVGSAGALVVNAGGDTRATMRIGIVSNLANVAINYSLIYGHTLGPIEIPALGVGGAAIGSVFAYGLEATLILRTLAQPSPRRGWLATTCSLHVTGLARLEIDELERATRRAIVRLSLPALAERVVIHAGYLAYARIVTSLGAAAMAANQALITLESICFLAAEGFGVAAATVVGQYLGREDPAGSRRGGWLAASSCAGVLGVLGLVIWASAPWTVWAFVPEGQSDTAMIAIVLVTMPMLVLSQPVMGAAMVLGHALRGAGDTRSPLVAAVVGGLAIRVLGALVLARGLDLGLVGIWIATCCDWTVRTIILALVFGRGRWQSIRLDLERPRQA
ncbi:MATE family efflux transporter [Nannocystaceae bacterium ST9]